MAAQSPGHILPFQPSGVSVNEILASLVRLQEVDTEIQQLRAVLAEIPREVTGLQDSLREMQDRVEGLAGELKRFEQARRTKETDLETNQAKIAKYQGQLFSVKTNKEYSALLQEIEVLKEENLLIEEEIIELIDRIEDFGQKIKERERELSQDSARIEEEISERNKRLKEMEGMLEDKLGKRLGIAGKIKGDLLARYDKLCKNRGGRALAKAVEGACSGCHMILRPQMFSDVKRNDSIIPCGNCQRILYYEPEPAREKRD
jgi:predicted  nucleic acid-binding Zn-ribbon protein